MSPNPANSPMTGKDYRDYNAPDTEGRSQAIWWTIVALLFLAVIGYGAFTYYSPTSTMGVNATSHTTATPAPATPNATGTSIPEVPAPSQPGTKPQQ